MIRRFVYRAVARDGAATTRSVEARSRAEALRLAAQSGGAILDLTDAAPESHTSGGVSRAHAILVLRQMAVMTRAGINLLEALETIADSLPGAALAQRLRAMAMALRRGERLGDALERELPIFPPYVYALVRAGESSGALPDVLALAAEQVAYERRVAGEIQNALVYPALLVVSGAASVCFLLYAVVPRFAGMLAHTNAQPNAFSRFVLETGVAFHAQAPGLAIAAILALIGMSVLLRTPEARRMLSDTAHATPGLRALLALRQRTAWSRVAALSLGAGVGILDAAALAANSLPDGRMKRAVGAAIPALRAGRPIDAAFRETGALAAIDASLVRAGQRSGALPEMFRAVADRNEQDLKDTLKLMTVIVEPLAIATVAIMVGAIVLGLAFALIGVYESI